ncbi:LysR family transcriptional regulator [Spelaeicoccus albus]|uniref:DNA-binding transcriptional LysR family regulator n=1 Tax=Spelaeicoccus albus TaxID=1280376 RepID=A0A7Z0A9R4_9MICO|nr:LysR family transcriptional regulator [Spelaeicoccus albus]NYI66183.1 DNA-binding transcriptional LysR family regulator [Spelaeicoccus albus]
MIDHRLQVLRVVAEMGTVTAAARALNYTPSAVTHQLRGLAEDVGAPLTVPHGRNIRLTPAARVLLAHADELFARWEEIRAELSESLPDAGVGTLTLCGFSTAAAALLPSVVVAVRQRFARLDVHIIEADPEECFDLLLTDDADVAVVVATSSLPQSGDRRFDQRLLFDDPLDLLVPADHPLAGRQRVRLSEAASEPWIVDRPGRPYRGLVLAACSAAGFTPAVAHESSEWDTGAALVSAGLGVALVPRLARLPHGYRVERIRLLGDPAPSRRILTGVRAGSRSQPGIAAALDALVETADRVHAG